MGDVQLPLRLSTSYYVGVSTSNVGENTSPVSHATLLTFAKPTFIRFFRLPNYAKERKNHEAKAGGATKVAASLHWPFFSVVRSKGSETGSPSSSSGDGVESPPEKSSSPASSISPSSVLSKKLFIEENGDKKIGRDSIESFLSRNDAPKLSSVEEGEKQIKWDAFGPFARYDHQDDDDLIELDITKSESSSICGDPSGSLRRSTGSDILRAEAGDAMMGNSAEIGEEEVRWDDGDPGKGCGVAPSLPESKKAMACKGGNPHLALKLSGRLSGSGPLGHFIGKLLRAMSFSRGSHSTTLWVNLKKSAVLLAAGKMSPKEKPGGEEGEVELWKKNIPMGRRCRVLELEDSSYENNGGRELKAVEVEEVGDVHRNSGGGEAMAQRLLLCELMDAGAEAPLFSWTSREARPF